jgi:hypothetical protein
MHAYYSFRSTVNSVEWQWCGRIVSLLEAPTGLTTKTLENETNRVNERNKSLIRVNEQVSVQDHPTRHFFV